MTKQTLWLVSMYTLLQRLYPPDFRAQFASEMQQIFAALLTEAYQQPNRALLRLCLHEFGGLLYSIIQEWICFMRDRVRQAPFPHPSQPVTPAAWSEVLLTTLPGLWWLAAYCSFFLDAPPVNPNIWLFFGRTPLTENPHANWSAAPFGMMLTWILLGWFLWITLRCTIRQRFDPAALPLLGLSVGLLVAIGSGVLISVLNATVGYQAHMLFGVMALSSIFLAVVVVGGWIARRHGAHALLIITCVGSIIQSWIHQPLYAFDPAPAPLWLIHFIFILPTVGWLIVTPLALLRARTVGGQVLAGSLPVIITNGIVLLTARRMLLSTYPNAFDYWLWQIAVVLLLGSALALVSWSYVIISQLAPQYMLYSEKENNF